jgi:hypothetical protein
VGTLVGSPPWGGPGSFHQQPTMALNGGLNVFVLCLLYSSMFRIANFVGPSIAPHR